MKKPQVKKTVYTDMREIIQDIEATYGANTIYEFGNAPVVAVDTIPTGSLSLDLATGIGGMPVGRIVEIFGPESSGKTTLALHILNNAMVKFPEKHAVYIDIEHAIDQRYAECIAPDFRKVIFSQPDTAESALGIIEKLAQSGKVSLIVVDSVAAMIPTAELEGDFGKPTMGLHARLMSQACRKLVGIIHKTNTILLFINQIRSKIGIVFGNPETTTGGRALKFFSSMRLDIRSAGKISAANDVVANKTVVKIVKNKLARPFQEAEFIIRFGEGIDLPTELILAGTERGIIKKTGNTFSYKNKTMAVGMEKMRAWLISHESFRIALQERLQILHNKEVNNE